MTAKENIDMKILKCHANTLEVQLTSAVAVMERQDAVIVKIRDDNHDLTDDLETLKLSAQRLAHTLGELRMQRLKEKAARSIRLDAGGYADESEF